MEWFYEKDGSQQGPVSEDALKALFGRGELAGNTLVWRDGMGDWATYLSVFPEATAASVPLAVSAQRGFADASASGLRREAREALAGNWWSGVLVTFLYQLLQQIAMAIPLLGLIAPFVITGPMLLGYHAYLQGLIRREPVAVGTLFDGFQRMGQGMSIFCVTFLIIMFASILASIPGGFFVGNVMSDSQTSFGENPLFVVAIFVAIIPAVLVATYFWLRYSMVYFIANDHPEMGALDAMKRSGEMMDGHKVRLFILSLTFIGWYILGFLALGIGVLWASIYMFVAFAAFYDDLRNRQLS